MKSIKLKLSILISFLFFEISSFAVPRGSQELVPSGHWIYDSLMAICLESGIVNFADCAPLSIQELKLYLSEIDYEKLSDAGKTDFNKINKYFEESNISVGNDILSIGISPTLNTEGFYKSNDDIDWVFDRYERSHFLDMPATITCGDYFTMSMDVYLGENRGMSLHDDNYTNIPVAADEVDVNFPDDGYFSTGKMLTEKTGIGFQIGKGERSIGQNTLGSIIYSNHLTGVSYAQFEAYCPSFKYTGSVAQFNVDKYYYSHQIDVRLFKKLQVTFYEALIVNHSMELRFLNPWMVFHGFSPWRDYAPDQDDTEDHTGDYFCVKAQYTPIKNLRLYGNFAMTQYQTSYELEKWPTDVTPNGLGFQFGSEYYVPVNQGRLRFSLEGSIADPYLYIKESPNWTFVRTYSENIGDQAIFYEWIGSPFGPDTAAAEAKISYEVPEKYSIDLTYLFMARGEMSGNKVFENLEWGGQYTDFPYRDGENDGKDNVKDWAYPDNSAQGHDEAKRRQGLTCPSGTAELVNRISSRMTLYPNDWLTIAFQPAYVLIFNHNNESGKTEHGFEFALSTKINPLKIKK